jgi:hypothetical protein
MKQFLALYMATPAAIKTMMKTPPEQMPAVMDEWNKWAKVNKAAIAELGAPLGKTKHLTAKRLTNTKNGITGYTVVRADSAEAAAKLFDGNPHLKMKGTSIDLIECLEM